MADETAGRQSVVTTRRVVLGVVLFALAALGIAFGPRVYFALTAQPRPTPEFVRAANALVAKRLPAGTSRAQAVENGKKLLAICNAYQKRYKALPVELGLDDEIAFVDYGFSRDSPAPAGGKEAALQMHKALVIEGTMQALRDIRLLSPVMFEAAEDRPLLRPIGNNIYEHSSLRSAARALWLDAVVAMDASDDKQAIESIRAIQALTLGHGHAPTDVAWSSAESIRSLVVRGLLDRLRDGALPPNMYSPLIECVQANWRAIPIPDRIELLDFQMQDSIAHNYLSGKDGRNAAGTAWNNLNTNPALELSRKRQISFNYQGYNMARRGEVEASAQRITQAARAIISQPASRRQDFYASVDVELQETFVSGSTYKLAFDDWKDVDQSMLIIALALAAHHQQTGQYPPALTALVPTQLAALPQDPFAPDGLFRYRRTDESYLLWSVGISGIDNQGKADVTESLKPLIDFDVSKEFDHVFRVPAK